MTKPEKPIKKRRSRGRPDPNAWRPLDALLSSGWLVLVTLAMAVAAFANSFDGAFLLDDYKHLTKNMQAKASGEWIETVLDSARPVVAWSLYANFDAAGDNPRGYHAFNLAVHLLAAAALFGVVFETLRSRAMPERFRDRAGILACAIATIWAVHPLQTASVTYIAQRAESMMGMLYLVTLYTFIRGARTESIHRGRCWFAIAGAACALGMASKAVMATAPIIVILYDRTFLAASWRDVLTRRKFIHASLAVTLVVIFLCGVGGTLLFGDANEEAAAGFAVTGVSPLEYAMTQPETIVHYLRLAIWPTGQCLDYQWPIATPGPKMWFCTALIGGLLILTIFALIGRPRIGFLGAWFFVILGPTSSVIPIMDLAFEHRMYLPLAAVVCGGVLLGGEAIRNMCHQRRTRFAAAGLMIVGVTASLTVATVRRNALYADDARMWQNVVEISPRNDRAFVSLGFALAKKGLTEEAIDAYKSAITVNSENPSAYVNMANSLFKLERAEEAVVAYDQALALGHDAFNGYYGRAQALAAVDRHEEAIASFEKAIALRPDHLGAHTLFGILLHRVGRYEDAIEHYQESNRMAPREPMIITNLGIAHQALGRFTEAEQFYREALTISPGYQPAQQGLSSLTGGIQP